MSRAFLSLLLLCLVAAPAAAQNASAPGAIELYPTLQSIGVRLASAGDANGNATARLEWRPTGAATWTAGVPMTRIQNQRWAGSVFWLSPDTPYEVRAIVTDPDGGGATVTGSVRTRRAPSTTPTGATWYVATNGNDANSGSSTAPLATLQAAAAKANPGDQIRVRAGIYYQSLDVPRSGSSTALIHVVGDAGAILDGSDPASLHRTDWRSDGGGIYSVPWTAAVRLVVVDTDQRLYHHASLSALQSNANGVAQGYALENGRLFVKLEDGSAPAGHTVHIARSNVGILVDASWWRIDGLEVRYFGNAAGGFGIYVNGASGCVLSDNLIHDIGGKAIGLRTGSSNCLIERNTVSDGRIGSWPWSAVKAHEEESAAISNRGGRGNVFRFNTITNAFDGMDCGDGTTDENIGADCDFHDNVIVGCGDDAFETDDISGINVRIYRNVIRDGFNGFSLAPILQGPEYVLFNTVTGFRRSAFKYSYASSGHAYLYHNTVVSDRSGAPAVWPTGAYSNQHFRNNIFVCTGIGVVNDDPGESQTGIDFDSDLLWTTGSTLFRWKGVNYSSLTSLRSATGFESAGRWSSPTFASVSSGNYAPVPTSPVVDNGVRLPGINDAFTGLAPDLGAFELTVDLVRPAPIQDLH